jgi:predicted metal-dependent enzyme (double-stranded beta helix superfamily)
MSETVETITESERILAEYVEEVRLLVESKAPIEETVDAVVSAHGRLLVPGFRLPERYRSIRDDVPYTRNLVYQDPAKRFAVVAICWGPFRETRVHDHLNWCVVGVLEGSVHAIDYDRLDDESDPDHADLAIRATGLHGRGSVIGLTPPPRSNIHKMANGGRSGTVSLHTYGDPGTRARVFDPATGRVEIMELAFHNLT